MAVPVVPEEMRYSPAVSRAMAVTAGTERARVTAVTVATVAMPWLREHPLATAVTAAAQETLATVVTVAREATARTAPQDRSHKPMAATPRAVARAVTEEPVAPHQVMVVPAAQGATAVTVVQAPQGPPVLLVVDSRPGATAVTEATEAAEATEVPVE
jgi:hypothetical protein